MISIRANWPFNLLGKFPVDVGGQDKAELSRKNFVSGSCLPGYTSKSASTLHINTQYEFKNL